MHILDKMSSSRAGRRQNNRPSAGVRPSSAFTIVELLIVIVIIGILAAITIVSYSGITQKANTAALQSDLTNASKKLALYYAVNNTYPTAIDQTTGCPTTPIYDSNYCIKPSNGAIFTYEAKTPTQDFLLSVQKNNETYQIKRGTEPLSAWITIGTQSWARYNLNVGTMIIGSTEQTNNSVLEKYCYNDDESNCTKYGGLYQWNETMQYTTVESTQGICPTGSHVPSDNEWKILEIQLGMTQAQAELDLQYRGTDQGTQLKYGGASGLNIPLAGYRSTVPSFGTILSIANQWSSTESSVSVARRRVLHTTYSNVYRGTDSKNVGYSVRCLKD